MEPSGLLVSACSVRGQGQSTAVPRSGKRRRPTLARASVPARLGRWPRSGHEKVYAIREISLVDRSSRTFRSGAAILALSSIVVPTAGHRRHRPGAPHAGNKSVPIPSAGRSG